MEPESPPEQCDQFCTSQTHQIYYTCPLEQVTQRLDKNLSQQFALLFPKDTKTVSSNIIDMVQSFSQATYTRGLPVNPDSVDSRVPLIVWKSCAYTIRTMEILLRDLNKPLLGDLSSRQKDCLESLIRIVAIIGSTWKKPIIIISHALKLLSMVLEHPADGPSILDWDSFGLLVPLTLALPSLYYEKCVPVATGGVQDGHVLRLILLSHISKLLISCNFVEESLEDMDVDEGSDLTDLEKELITELLNSTQPNRKLSPNLVWNKIKDASIPFLRCCVLFFHFLTDIPAPAALTEIGGDTFENMCCYLGLSESCYDLLEPLKSSGLIELWCKHPDVANYIKDHTTKDVVEEPLSIARLVSLPTDYSELINTVSLFTCPNSDREDSRNPTMCLACGEMLCSQSYCCQTELNKSLVGACTYHAYKCGAGVGIFLRVRECEILFLASPSRGCFAPPPYLDDYGETDQGLRRGNPLHLCVDRYKNLHNLWLSHRLHEEIARALESNNTLMSTQWQHL